MIHLFKFIELDDENKFSTANGTKIMGSRYHDRNLIGIVENIILL